MKVVVKEGAWVKPTKHYISLYHKVEWCDKGLYRLYGDVFPTVGDLQAAVNNGTVVTLTKRSDSKIINRSHRTTEEEIYGLYSKYKGWQEFRNEKEFQEIIDRLTTGEPVEMPIIFEREGKRRLFTGNVVLDLAFLKGIQPKVIIVQV